MTLRRIFSDYTYGNGPRKGCWWDETCAVPKTYPLAEDITVDVAIVGGGFTGVCAALTLAEQGVRTALLEAQEIGWGASGRNGGFCCLGGGKISDAALDKTYGRAARLAFRDAEKQAVSYVDDFISKRRLDVDRHSQGETVLAHRPSRMEELRREADSVFENYGVEVELIDPSDLEARGMCGGPFFGAMTIPIGFGINPRKYLAGLTTFALQIGALLHSQSPVQRQEVVSGKHRLTTPGGTVTADQVVVATNGYSSENMPGWLAGRFMPGQSTVLVTRPLTLDEISAQGWVTEQMSYDTRDLLHYFRLLPDRRFLFGMRGGLMSGPGAERKARARARIDFERMFPAWRHVETTHTWSGMVNLARKRVPFVGKVPSHRGLWAAMCYHGNGVAMGSYAGHMVAHLLMGRSDDVFASVMQTPLQRFPFGQARRCLMPPLYAVLNLKDRL